VLDVSNEADTYLDYLKISYRDTPRRYLRCNDCELIYRDPALDDAEKALLYERFRDYDLRKETKEEYFARITSLPPGESENAEKLDFLGPYLAEKGRVLDVGCGAGVFLYAFKQRNPGWEPFGCEPTADFSAVARQHGIRIVSEYLTPKTFDVRFDLITMIHVVEHLDRPLELLGVVRDYLKPGGLLYVECPSDQDIGFLAAGHDRFMCQHEVIYSERTLDRTVRQAQLSPVFTGTFVSKRKRNNVRVLAQRPAEQRA
jgi:SAM-dependent methyltransferase